MTSAKIWPMAPPPPSHLVIVIFCYLTHAPPPPPPPSQVDVNQNVHLDRVELVVQDPLYSRV